MSSDKSFIDTVVDTVAEAFRHFSEDDDEGVSDIIVGSNHVIDLSNVKEFRIHIGTD